MNGRTGALIGLVAGYPLSYFFQPSALRAKMGLGTYISHIRDILTSNDLSGTVIGVWIGSVVLFAVVGEAVARSRTGGSARP